VTVGTPGTANIAVGQTLVGSAFPGGSATITAISYGTHNGTFNGQTLTMSESATSNTAPTVINAPTRTLTLTGVTGGSIAGILTDYTAGEGATNVKLGLNKTGNGTWTLSGINTFTGGATVAAGTLSLNFASASGNNILATTGSLTLAGGTLSLQGASAASRTQTVSGSTFNPGASSIVLNSNSTNLLGLTLAGLTRNVGSTLNITQPGNPLGATNGVQTTTGFGSTILTDPSGVAYATVGGSDWAAKDSTNAWIVGGSTLSGFYTPDTGNALTPATNADMSVPGTTNVASGTTLSSLRFNNPAADTISITGGQTLITGGILETPSVLGNADLISGGSLEGISGKDLVLIQNNTTAGGALTISSVVADNTSATALTKSGLGTVVLSGPNTYTGVTYINAGVLNAGVAESATVSGPFGKSAAANAGSIVFGGGTLQFSALNNTDYSGRFATTAQPIVIDTNGRSVTFATSLMPATAGSLQLVDSNGTPGTLTLGVANTYTGPTTVTGGTLAVGIANAIGIGSAVTVNGGTLSLASFNDSVASVSLQGGSITGGAGILTSSATYDVRSGSVGAILNGGNGLTKSTSGAVTLGGANIYSGATNVSAGALIVSGSLTGTTSVSVANLASLEVDGSLNKAAAITVNGTLQGTGNVGAVSVTNGGTLAPGYAVGSTTSGTLTANGAVTLNGSSTFSIRLGLSSAGTDSDQLMANGGVGSVSLNGANLQLTLNTANVNPPTSPLPTFYDIIVGGAESTGGTNVFNSVNGQSLAGSNTFTYGAGWQFTIEYAATATGGTGGNEVVLEMTAIPEPGTWAMLFSGVGMLIVWQHGRRRRK
jgi:autotransporter-associated beta strand protein